MVSRLTRWRCLITMAKQFNSHMYYTRSMMNTMEVLLKSHTMLHTGN